MTISEVQEWIPAYAITNDTTLRQYNIKFTKIFIPFKYDILKLNQMLI